MRRFVFDIDKAVAAAAHVTRKKKGQRISIFELLKTIPIQTNDYRVAGIELQIFRNNMAEPEPASTVEIPMETLPHDLVLPLARLAGHPWPTAKTRGQ